MSGVDAVFWWTGAAICCTVAAAWCFGVLLYFFAFVRAFVLAIDIHVWMYKAAKINGDRFNWSKSPKSFAADCRSLLYKSRGEISFACRGGVWRGFRDWNVYREDQAIQGQTIYGEGQ
jgi:hypothetical protein